MTTITKNNVTNIFKNKSKWEAAKQNKYDVVVKRIDSILDHFDDKELVFHTLAYAARDLPPLRGRLYPNCKQLAQYAGPILLTNVALTEHGQNLHRLFRSEVCEAMVAQGQELWEAQLGITTK